MIKRIALVLFVTFGIQVTAEEKPASQPKLSDAAWLAGVWKNVSGEQMTFEEHWTAPAASNMMGMFRLLSGERVIVFEYLLIEQEPDGTYMRLRHYQPQMKDVDAAPIRCRLVEATSQKLIFENSGGDKPKRISYELADNQQLTVSVETVRDSKPTTFKLRLQREAK